MLHEYNETSLILWHFTLSIHALNQNYDTSLNAFVIHSNGILKRLLTNDNSAVAILGRSKIINS